MFKFIKNGCLLASLVCIASLPIIATSCQQNNDNLSKIDAYLKKHAIPADYLENHWASETPTAAIVCDGIAPILFSQFQQIMFNSFVFMNYINFKLSTSCVFNSFKINTGEFYFDCDVTSDDDQYNLVVDIKTSGPNTMFIKEDITRLTSSSSLALVAYTYDNIADDHKDPDTFHFLCEQTSSTPVAFDQTTPAACQFSSGFTFSNSIRWLPFNDPTKDTNSYNRIRFGTDTNGYVEFIMSKYDLTKVKLPVVS